MSYALAPQTALAFAESHVRDLRARMPRAGRWNADPAVLARNLRYSDALAVLAVERALCDVHLMETPPGSNRSPSIDTYNERAGAPLGSPYCASAWSCWWEDVGLEVPKRGERPSCDAVYRWAVATQRFSKQPAVGAAILYGDGKPADPAQHIGIVIRLTPLLTTLEANTTFDGKFNREGFCFHFKAPQVTNPPSGQRPVLGFVHPYRVAA